MTSGPAYEKWLTARAVFDALGELADDVMAGSAPLSVEEVLRRREALRPVIFGHVDTPGEPS